MTRKTIAQNIVKQAKIKANNEKFDDYIKNISNTKISTLINEAGVETLTAQFNNAGEDTFEIDISIFKEYPNLCEPFSTAFISWGSSLGNRTRQEAFRLLRRYLFTFITEKEINNISLAQMNKEFFASFKTWLDSKLTNGQPLSNETRRIAIAAVKHMIDELVTSIKWHAIASQVREAIPKAPYHLSYKKIKPTSRLLLDDLRLIINAAEIDLINLRERFDHGSQMLSDGQDILKSRNIDYSNFSCCLALLASKYPGVVPDINIIKKHDKKLALWTIRHRTLKLSSYLYPTARDLAPFIILLLIITTLNSDQLLSLSWGNIDNLAERIGTPAVRITTNKNRSSSIQSILLDASSQKYNTNIKDTLEFLNKITSRLRISATNKSERDMIFLFSQKNRKKTPKSFGSEKSSPSGDNPLKNAIANFIKDYNLTYFTLSQIRPTILDEIQFNNGNIADAQAVGGHKSIWTTWTHYTSDGTKSRYQERIGEILLLRERWLVSEGKIDPRITTLNNDKGSATPGFMCLDPFNSPRSNQQNGKLCSAYGECPSCPLAAANIGNVTNAAMYQALQTAIFAAQATLSPLVWLERWSPVASDLNALLLLIPAEIASQAKLITIKLPSVG